jgi:integrase
MATIKFKLDGEKIYLHYRQGISEFQFYTPHKCNPKNWDGDEKKQVKGVEIRVKGKGRIKGSSTEALKINEYLDSLENDLRVLISSERIQKSKIGLKPDFQNIKKLFLEKHKVSIASLTSEDRIISITNLFQSYIEDRRHLLSNAVVFLFKRVGNHLKTFIKKYKIKDDITSIDSSFFQKYQKFLVEDIQYLNTTINIEIKKVREVLNFYKESYPVINIPKKLKDLPEPDSHRFTMTFDESKTFYNINFKDDQIEKDGKNIKVGKGILEAVRDCYIFSFNTGIPYEPLCMLDIDNINHLEITEEKTIYLLGDLTFEDSNQMLNYLSTNKMLVSSSTDISYKTQLSRRRIPILQYHRTKSKKILVTPLNDICLEIIDKYKDKQNKLLPMMSNQKMNFYIHIALKQSGLFNDEVHYVNYRGKTTITKKMPRYEAITFHSARHGFASYLLNSGLPISFIQKLLGHSDLKTTQIYAKANANDVLKKAFELLQ